MVDSWVYWLTYIIDYNYIMNQSVWSISPSSCGFAWAIQGIFHPNTALLQGDLPSGTPERTGQHCFEEWPDERINLRNLVEQFYFTMLINSSKWGGYYHLVMINSLPWEKKIIDSPSISMGDFPWLWWFLGDASSSSCRCSCLRSVVRQQFQLKLPFGKHTKNYGKSPLFTGKYTVNGHCQ